MLDELGLLGDHCCIAHCVHLSADERRLLAARGAHVCHCPSSNLKLASGICPVPELIAAGVSVAIGADGAPCNNNLDGLLELRLTALLHKHRAGPRALPAPEVVRMATLGGAAALGLADQIGSLELGKRGDVIAVDVTAAAHGAGREPVVGDRVRRARRRRPPRRGRRRGWSCATARFAPWSCPGCARTRAPPPRDCFAEPHIALSVSGLRCPRSGVG